MKRCMTCLCSTDSTLAVIPFFWWHLPRKPTSNIWKVSDVGKTASRSVLHGLSLSTVPIWLAYVRNLNCQWNTNPSACPDVVRVSSLAPHPPSFRAKFPVSFAVSPIRLRAHACSSNKTRGSVGQSERLRVRSRSIRWGILTKPSDSPDSVSHPSIAPGRERGREQGANTAAKPAAKPCWAISKVSTDLIYRAFCFTHLLFYCSTYLVLISML